jgi:hypothetical protein
VRQSFEGLGYDLLLWPEDVDGRHLSARAMQATLGDPRFDAILITRPVSIDGLAVLWERKALYVLPVVDLTGSLAGSPTSMVPSWARSTRNISDT